MSEIQKLILSVSLELAVILIFSSLSLIFVASDRPEGLLFLIPMMFLAPLAARSIKR